MKVVPTVRVDDEVFSSLQEQATPFVDTPNSVLRRVLGLDEPSRQPGTKSRRATSGELLPHSAYRPAVLQALAERGGAAPAREIINSVGQRLRDELKPRDFEANNSGVVRWENRVQWQRQRLKEQGLIKPDSPVGVWELTEAGQEEAAKLASAAATRPTATQQ
jgi:Mrr N-terminal domain